MYAISRFTRKSCILYAKSLTGRTSRTIYVRSSYKRFQQIDKIFQKINKDSNPLFSFFATSITSIMRSEQVKSVQPSCGVLQKRSGTSAPISLEELMGKKCSRPLRTALFVSCRSFPTQATNTAPRSSGRSASWTTPRISSRFFKQDLLSRRG